MAPRDAYSIPRIDECIDSLGDAQIISTLDASSDYWQITIAPKEMYKTTFATHFGTYAFMRMPLDSRINQQRTKVRSTRYLSRSSDSLLSRTWTA